MNKQHYDKTAYDLATERDIYWVHPGARPAYLRECVGHLPPTEHDYYKPSIQPHADLWAYALVDTPHNMPRKCRCWFLLSNVKDGLDIRKAAENAYASDRLVDPRSIEAGKPSKPATPRSADRHAKRILKKRRVYHARKARFFDNGGRWPKPTLWQRIKALFGAKTNA